MQGREEEGVGDPGWHEERQPLGQRAQLSAGPLCRWRVTAERASAFLQTGGAVGWKAASCGWRWKGRIRRGEDVGQPAEMNKRQEASGLSGNTVARWTESKTLQRGERKLWLA